jgi:hypothetical protein
MGEEGLLVADLNWYRDLVIVIFCILASLLGVGWFVVFCILYAKLNGFSTKANLILKSTKQSMAYIQGLLKGLNDTMSIFNRGG